MRSSTGLREDGQQFLRHAGERSRNFTRNGSDFGAFYDPPENLWLKVFFTDSEKGQAAGREFLIPGGRCRVMTHAVLVSMGTRFKGQECHTLYRRKGSPSTRNDGARTKPLLEMQRVW
jgi:hypothetical protein